MAEGLGFTGSPYSTYGVDPVATAPPMALEVSEPVASSSTHAGIHQPIPRRYAKDYHRPPTGVGPTFFPVQRQSLAMPCQCLVLNLSEAFGALSHLGEGAGEQKGPLTGP